MGSEDPPHGCRWRDGGRVLSADSCQQGAARAEVTGPREPARRAVQNGETALARPTPNDQNTPHTKRLELVWKSEAEGDRQPCAHGGIMVGRVDALHRQIG